MDTFSWCWDWHTSVNCLLMHEMSLYCTWDVWAQLDMLTLHSKLVSYLQRTAGSHQLCAPALEILRLTVVADCFLSSSRFIWAGKYFSLKRGKEWIRIYTEHKKRRSTTAPSMQFPFPLKTCFFCREWWAIKEIVVACVFACLIFEDAWSDTMNNHLPGSSSKLSASLSISNVDLSCRKGRIMGNHRKIQINPKHILLYRIRKAIPEGHSAKVILEIANECMSCFILMCVANYYV